MRDIAWRGHRLRVVDSQRSFWDKVDAGSWEPETQAFLAERIRPETVFIDLGAWIGPTTLIAASLGARVVAFEPNPDAREIMRRSVEASGLADRVLLVPNAIWKHSGTEALSVGRASSGASLIVKRRRHSSVPVECKQAAFLDQFIVPGVALIKMDIEGAEYDVLSDVADVALPRKADILVSTHPHKAVDYKRKTSFLINPLLGVSLLWRLLSLRRQVARFPAAHVLEMRDGTFMLREPHMRDFFRQSQLFLSH